MTDLANGLTGESCYACDEPATTKEHAPPYSFFPKGKRQNLITVPSCSVHNCSNSNDVEYVRNAIASLADLNEAGESLIDTTKRSFDHSPALFKRTFKSFVVRSLENQIGTFRFDLKRVDRVMVAVVQALHYRDTGQKWGHWLVFVPSLRSESSLVNGTPDGCEGLRNLVSSIRYEERPTAEPEAFRYASRPLDWGWVYRLTFYDTFVVNVLMVTPMDEEKYLRRKQDHEGQISAH